jgi:hypothetical protein
MPPLPPDPVPPPSAPRPSAPGSSPTPGPGRPDATRFRRPERPSPSPTPTEVDVVPAGTVPGREGQNGASPSAEGADVAASGGESSALASAAQTRALAEPLAALAAAFQANAEALRRSQEVTADLGRALQRADRSELMLQSTGALNETFKGVTAVQRKLLQRVEDSEKASREGRWFLPAIVLGAVALVGGVAWIVVKRMDQVEDSVVGTGDVATQISAAAKDARTEATKDAQARLEEERSRSEARIRELEDRLRVVEADRDEQKSARQSVEGDLAAARAELTTNRVDVLKVKALEDEANRLRAEAAVRDPEIDRLRRELAEESRLSSDLRKRLVDAGVNRPIPGGPETNPTPETTGPTAPPAPPPEGPSAKGQVERARIRLNELLQVGAAARTDYLEINRIGAIEGNRLSEVQATRRGLGGKATNSIRARDATITVDRSLRRVEMVFTEGTLDFNGKSVPFPSGQFSVFVAEGDAVTAWTAANLPFVSVR